MTEAGGGWDGDGAGSDRALRRPGPAAAGTVTGPAATGTGGGWDGDRAGGDRDRRRLGR
ncbi:hypothetical protein GCM10010389_54630 [Streptomyces echinoruber]|uniref:Uncharacterized protein n=1 Tax=Streptomyces echinoruber TaxID=68898 RepID=A0A918RRT8_9ACTN|nr:hypothetical protein GCM10010389_54630 [Streptomyces echinoruber]